jgi:ferrochelatase
MRYGTPSCAEAVQEVLKHGIDDLFVMPQYPHYAMSSDETVVVKIQEELARLAPNLKYHVLQPYFNDPAYIDCLVESAKPWLSKPFDKILFSYHGVPERHLRKATPPRPTAPRSRTAASRPSPSHANCYKHQCVQTTLLFAQRAGLSPDKFEMSFQSRFGPEKWVPPYTDERFEALPSEGVKQACS